MIALLVRSPRVSWRLAVLAVAALAVAGLCATAPAIAHADTAPAAGTPATVSADGLPTVQQNGVVWSQVTVGNTVYATGSFSETVPAGATMTAANETPRANLLAYDITTGNLITGFNHTLNAQGLAITASPDGSRIYVVGDFTTVDGQAHNHLAAFTTATGALVSTFAASTNAHADAVSATNSTVYAGGTFTMANGQPRSRLAAFTATTGSLVSTWAPSAENSVNAILVTPDQTEVVIGGAFQTLDGVNEYGLGAVTVATGAAVPYAINNNVRDYQPIGQSNPGKGAAILSLRTDGTTVYGSGYSYGLGDFEGNFAVDPDTGAIKTLNDCHGDTYDVLPIGQVLYTVSHNHDCSAIGAFPETSPRTWHRALAFTTYPTGTNSGPDSYGWNYSGIPDSTLLQWYPTLVAGTVTGQDQAAWSLTGNASYIALGGEFPSVNGVAQAGLVRFAVSSLAPNKRGPTGTSALTPVLTAPAPATVSVTWNATWDMDNQALTYSLYRDGRVVDTVTTNSNFWTLSTTSYTDTGMAPGKHTYQVKVVDPFKNSVSSSTASITTS